MLNGIPKREAERALLPSLINAYKSLSYLDAWRKRVNPEWYKKNKNKILDLDFETTEGMLFTVTDEANKVPESVWKHFDDYNSSPKPAPAAPQTLNGNANKPVPSDLEQLAETLAQSIRGKLAHENQNLRNNLENKIGDLKNELELKTGNIETLVNRSIRSVVTTLRAEVIDVIKQIKAAQPTEVIIKNETNNTVKSIGTQHFKFPTLLRACQAKANNRRLNIWLTGPTGSGKTTACEKVAEALNLPFASDGSLDADYKVMGFRDANGTVRSTEFLRVYTNGGIYCADEIDNWLPSALLSLNSALANDFMSTPGGLIRRHVDFICIACANTWGLGATSEYVGRARLDAASLDRFHPKINWPYDEGLEMVLCPDKQFCAKVQNLRLKAKNQGLQIIISPRASFTGAGLIQQGFSTDEALDMTVFAALSPEQKTSLTR
jgi:hypothetical protein